MTELEIHEVFPVLQKGDSLFAGTFNSNDFPYKPAPPVRCNYYSAFLIVQGSGFIIADNHEFEVKPGRIFIFSSRQVIGWSYYKDTIGKVVAFTPHVAMALQVHCEKPCIDIPGNEITLYRELFENFIAEFSKHDKLSVQIMHAGITYLYNLLGRQPGVPGINDKVVVAFRNIVCGDFSATITVEAVAQQLHISSKLLNELCLKRIGINAKQYIIELKLTEAKRLLAFTDYNASEISFQTGFEDPSYFARIFRKKNGITPTAFKKKYQTKS